MAMIKLPRLYVNGAFSRIIYPEIVSITLNTIPLSTATITLPRDETLPARSYVELFTPYGSAGMFRVRQPKDAYGQDDPAAELEHMISEVNDYLAKEEASEMLAADAAMKRVFKFYKGGKWKLGNVSALGTGKIAYEVKYDGILEVMLALLQQKPDCMLEYDFSTTPWTVSVKKKDTTVTAEGRLARNITSASVNYEDSELCTRAWYQTFSNGVGTWKSKDADTLAKYGVIEKVIRTSADMTADEITRTVDTYLKEHKNPRVGISIQAVSLEKITGESRDKFENGKLFRLALPDHDITIEETINSVFWSDVYNHPDEMQIHLGDDEDTVITFLHNLDASGAGGGGGGGAKDKKEKEWSAYKSDWKVRDDLIYGYVQKSDKFGKILEQAGMNLNSQGVLIYSKNSESNIMSHINTQADRISLVVKGSGKNAKINTAKIVAGINDQGGSFVKIKADKINLSGYVTMKQFKATDAEIARLKAGTSKFAIVRASSGNISSITSTRISVSDTLSIFGHNCYFKAVMTPDGTTTYCLGY